MAIEDAQQFHEMQLRIHDQNMADASAKSQRDAIAMIENTHQRNPFDDGGATLRLMSRDTTASAAQIMQFAIEDQRPTYQHDGMDLITPSFPSSSWMELPIPTSLPPPFLLRDSLLFLLLLYPFRLTVLKRNAQELMAQLFRTVARGSIIIGSKSSTGRAIKDVESCYISMNPLRC